VAGNADLPEAVDHLERGCDGIVRGKLGTYDLDERHERRRVEEMHTHDPFGRPGRRRDLRDGERGGVRGENGIRATAPLELAEERAFGLQLLDDRLDHEVAVREPGHIGRRS
jgi:hypothetical protein